MPPYVSRINQIDAAELDNEIYKVLREQTREITKHLPPGKIDIWQPEVDALIKLFIWSFSLRKGDSTFGQQLLNLRYSNFNKRKSALYLILSVFPPYFYEKLSRSDINLPENAEITAKRYVEFVVNAIKFLELANLLLFLHRGTQPQILERILGISASSVTTHRPRNIGYSYMTRELLWHGLMELFTVGLPMINFHCLKQYFARIFLRKSAQAVVKTFPKFHVRTKCAYCEETPILPCHAGCEHLFCYYCLKAHFTATSVFRCPACGIELRSNNFRYFQS